MDIVDTILSSTSGGAKSEISRRLGISEGDTEKVLAKIAPALGRGLASQSSAPDMFSGLISALKTGNHERYLEDPSKAGGESGIVEGNKILGHILGSKDVSRQLASRVAEQTGVSSELIKQALPMVATLVMGALSKQTRAVSDQSDGLQGILGSLLNRDDDGPGIDDLIGIAGKLFGR